jgi:hypothetical protein
MFSWSGIIKWLLIVIAGVLAPIALLWFGKAGEGQISVGPWQTSLAIGAAEAGMHTRAYVALTGLLALNRSETIYFEAHRDDDGNKLQAECSYDVSGGPIQARWWSITAYAGDNFLIPNPANRYSYNAKTLAADSGGRYLIALGPRQRPDHWLPTGERGGDFNLLLRLYNPDAEIAKAPGLASLPGIKRVGDC